MGKKAGWIADASGLLSHIRKKDLHVHVEFFVQLFMVFTIVLESIVTRGDDNHEFVHVVLHVL